MTSSEGHPGSLLQLGRVPYPAAWSLQHRLVAERIQNRRLDTLLLLEHDPVYTIGRRGRVEHWGGSDEALARTGIPVYHVERGGSITYHGPGQVVGYLIFRLTRFCAGPRPFVHSLEEAMVRTLARWGLEGRRLSPWPGVWVGETRPYKIASVGVRIAKGVTMHGFALNVSIDLTAFSPIVPCGIADCRVTSMAALLGQPVSESLVRQHLAEEMGGVFGIAWRVEDEPSREERIRVGEARTPMVTS
ncbi:MAG: lipoyl(octanoyl) transferase LipB [Nitrospirales bacterium]